MRRGAPRCYTKGGTVVGIELARFSDGRILRLEPVEDGEPIEEQQIVDTEAGAIELHTPRHPLVPAQPEDMRMRRALLAEWGADATAPLTTMCISSAGRDRLAVRRGALLASGEERVEQTLVIPSFLKRRSLPWQTRYMVTLYGLYPRYPLGYPPPLPLLTEELITKYLHDRVLPNSRVVTGYIGLYMHVLRVTGGYGDSPVYVEVLRYPAGDEGPQLRGQTWETPEREIKRAWQARSHLREVAFQRPAMSDAEKAALLDDYERHILALRPNPGAYHWRLTQDKLADRMGHSRSTITDNLGDCLGDRYWRKVLAWVGTLPRRKVLSEDVPVDQHLRDLLHR